VAMELITQENVNTINSFRCMNFNARTKKMRIEIKIQQRPALSFCVNLSTGIAGSNSCDITQDIFCDPRHSVWLEFTAISGS
jgi:hypothetical protein